MLLSLRYKFLFVHIAKTGGTSIRAALRSYKWKDPSRIPLFLCSRISSLSHHRLACKLPRHAKAIAAYEMLPRELFNELFKFAFVRNPWDLQVSSYHHIQRERPHLLKGIKNFEEFLRWKLNLSSRPYQYIIDTSIELQSDYLIDLHGNIIVDFIGRYERLGEDFQEACAKIGIKPPRLPHKRKAADRTAYKQYYTDETAELIAKHFRRDIDMFGYRF
ncbi:MAG TPA: sulfotransferase [Desulfobacteraceae bacterium]|nr:MAG: sulfotransferase [Desulfobacteraceae bacterium 4484_190.3]RLB16176.1 MAG: sulfotransferase [Deltaproteobacteria bacterium]HDZ24356.1 sulfotransferase [Desulfobacteraceae bacterium]